MVLTSLWHTFDICIVPMKWDTKTSSHFFKERCKRSTRDGETGFCRRYAVAGFLLKKRIVEESDKSLSADKSFSSAHANDEVHSLQLSFARYFLQIYPPTKNKAFCWGIELTSMAASSVVPNTSSVAMTAVSFAHCLLGVPNTSGRSELVSDSQFDNSDCDVCNF